VGLDAQHGRLVSDTRAFVDGRPADSAALIRFARNGYHHFTTMQVRAGAVRGLALHLARLSDATRQMFSVELDVAALRAHLRAALASTPDAAVRISVAARNHSVRAMPVSAQIETMILVDPPTPWRHAPMRVMSLPHTRYQPQLKHSGLFDLFALRQHAVRHGFDDAALLNRDHCISEGPTFNLGFVLDDLLIWPQAERLAGTTERLLQHAWTTIGGHQRQQRIALDDLATFHGAFACHSGGIWPLRCIDAQPFPSHGEWLTRLHQLWDVLPAESI
jgi:branched-subunit amino acid aminotransferase/4-amino-4-deoxychorismate lyase